MNCPKCESPMETVTVEEVEVDRCTQCQGVWVDALELEAITGKGLARMVDPGAPDSGARGNAVDRIPCPRCGGTGNMIRMVAVDQPHIWFEHCAVCHGAYFDAGEITDLSEHTLADYLRDLFASERR